MTMGPTPGSAAYLEQVDQVMTILKLGSADTPALEDQVISMFAVEPDFSRSAIMDAVGKYRRERRETLTPRDDHY